MKKKKILKIIVTTLVIIILGGVMYTNAISPKIYDRYLNRGINYLTEKKQEESIESLQKAININPKSAKARYYQAKAYFENRTVSDAEIKAIKKAKDKKGNCGFVYEENGEYFIAINFQVRFR